jgi:hypothetical protein
MEMKAGSDGRDIFIIFVFRKRIIVKAMGLQVSGSQNKKAIRPTWTT